MGKSIVHSLVEQAKVQEIKGSADPIRIWDSYRDQALQWRALLLLQFPVTVLAIITAVLIWQGRETIVNIPRNPAPGLYHPQELPDSLFVEEANSFVNLIATYTPTVARRQFTSARERLLEPLLSKFNAEIMREDLVQIEKTARSQIFYVDPTKTTVERVRNLVYVSLIGDLQKMISSRSLPTVKMEYRLTMQTIPRNDLNPYGIVIREAGLREIKEIKE